MKVLIIDDNKADMTLAQVFLSNKDDKNKFIIDESSNLTRGLDKIKINNYDVLLLDLGLPETNGMNTVNQVLNYLKVINKTLPIVILTGLEDYKIGRQALDLGIKDFLIKGEAKAKDVLRALNFAIYNNEMPKRTTFSLKKK